MCAALLVVGVGCSSSGGVRKARTAGQAPATGASSTSQVAAPAEIRSLDLREEGRTALIEIVADRTLVWTNYRDSSGNLVLELPNSQPAPGLDAQVTGQGLVSAIDVELLDDADRPLTRLVVRTREDSEHSLSTEGEILRLQLLPIGEEEPTALAYEPLAAEGEEITTTAASPDWGTVDAPHAGPPPTGVPATQLFSVEVVEAGPRRTVIQVAGDGEFDYTTFRLANPERFVVDLVGVVNTSSRTTVQVGNERIDQVRIGQFKPRPDPVSRVVFDLNELVEPDIERTADGLTISFGVAASAAEPAMTTLAQDAGAEPMPEAGEFEMAEGVGEPAATYGETPSEPEPISEMPAAVDEEPYPTTAEAAYGEADESVAETAPSEEPEPYVSAPPAVAEPPPAVAVYEPPPSAPAREPAPAGGDVALFEAQQVQLGAPDQAQSAVVPQFETVVVNRRERQYIGEPISMSLKNADLVETLRSFAKISDLNFVIQPGVSGSVTVELKNVPWDQAMEQILKINNLGMEIDGTIVRIAPADQLRAEAEEERRLRAARIASIPLRTVMKSLSYAQAAAISTLLRNRSGAILSQRGTVQVDARTNTLIIRELPSNIDTVLAVIENLDTPEPQVTIEARIIEATKSFARNLGIEWGFDFVADNEHGNSTGLVFPNNVSGDGGVGLLTGGANGFLNLTMGNILNTFNLNARIQAAESEGLVNVISAPSVTVLNNLAATIQSGLQIPIQTVSNRTVSVQFVNATLQLTVAPHVTAEGTIILTIDVAKRQPQLAFAIVGASNAPIATKQATTVVIVRDGGTAVIGGIYQVSTDQNQDRVPGLANIPILGHLFKNRNRNDNNDELMIFVTPRIVQM